MSRKHNKLINTSFTNSIFEKPQAVEALDEMPLMNASIINSQDYETATVSVKLMKGKAARNIKVLLLEDNKINQVLAVEMMAMLGISLVDVVENGFEGLERAMTNHYDLIVTDIIMPIMDGIEFTRKIRKCERYKEVPIIALTANVQEEQVEVYYKVGMNNYLMKPVDIMDFERVLELYFVG